MTKERCQLEVDMMTVDEQLETHWNEQDAIDEKWNALSALCGVAEAEM